MANKYAEHLLTQGMSTHSYNQGCGKGSSGSAWIRIILGSWIRIRIRIKSKFMDFKGLKMEPWRVCRPAIAASHHFDVEQDPDPH
jgi:hypothetical protein